MGHGLSIDDSEVKFLRKKKRFFLCFLHLKIINLKLSHSDCYLHKTSQSNVTGNPRIAKSFVYEKFTSLAKTHFIQHTQMGEEEKKSKEEAQEEDKSKLFNVPPLEGMSLSFYSSCISTDTYLAVILK